MIDRRKIMLASLAGLFMPLAAVYAQPAPEERREGPPPGPEHPGPDHREHAEERPPVRPHMPPPRHETRPRPPNPEGWRWREGHWTWDGRRWVWISGRWYR